MTYAHHFAKLVRVSASPAVLFEFLDDMVRLGGHMERRSAMMMGGRMTYETDAANGRNHGAVVRMRGRMLGLTLFVEEVVTEYDPPRHKAWETRGPLKLLILNAFRMGFGIEAANGGSDLRVFIDYEIPRTGVGRLVGTLLAPLYARWCVGRMVSDAQSHFLQAP